MSNTKKDGRIWVRIEAHDELIINEFSEALNISKSAFVRTMITNFIRENEERLEKIIDKNKCRG